MASGRRHYLLSPHSTILSYMGTVLQFSAYYYTSILYNLCGAAGRVSTCSAPTSTWNRVWNPHLHSHLGADARFELHDHPSNRLGISKGRIHDVPHTSCSGRRGCWPRDRLLLRVHAQGAHAARRCILPRRLPRRLPSCSATPEARVLVRGRTHGLRTGARFLTLTCTTCTTNLRY